MTSKPSRILLVDDDSATRVGLAELLTDAGYETRAVATFEEGLRALRTETPDLLRMTEAQAQEAAARQHGAEYVLKPVTPSVLLEMVRRKLAELAHSKFETLRRWERKTVTGGMPARIDDHPARILDVSYGGLRFEMARLGELPPSLSVRLPSADISVRADVVWHTPLGETGWLCGAAVSQTNLATAREWRGLVDAVT